VTAALRGYAALTHTQAILQERDRMQRLAVSKYDELTAQDITVAPNNGDFSDYGDTRYKWELALGTTDTTGLDTVQLTVTAVDATDTNQVQLNGLAYI